MNTVFQVKNNFDRDIVVTSSIGIKATIEPGVAFDINFPSDVYKVIVVEVAPAQGAEPKEPEPFVATSLTGARAPAQIVEPPTSGGGAGVSFGLAKKGL